MFHLIEPTYVFPKTELPKQQTHSQIGDASVWVMIRACLGCLMMPHGEHGSLVEGYMVS